MNFKKTIRKIKCLKNSVLERKSLNVTKTTQILFNLLNNLLNGNPFILTYTVIYNKYFLIIYNALINTGINGYLFVSIKFTKRLKKYL